MTDSQMEAARKMREALEQMQAFAGVMFGRGPSADIPEIVVSPLGVPVKLGRIMRETDAALSAASAAGIGDGE